MDAALDLRKRQQEQTSEAQPTSPQVGVVRIKNATGSDADRFSVLGLNVPVFGPSANLDSFKNKPVFRGVVPTSNDYLGMFAILLEPLRANAIGRGLLSGVCPVKIEVGSESHKFAEVKINAVTSLKSSAVGPAQILWKESGTGTLWALIRLGPAVMPGMLFAVKVTQTGGSAGNKTTTCSFTYTVKDLADQVLGTGMSPIKARPLYGALRNTGLPLGLGFYDLAGTFRLYDANETLDTESC